MRPIWAGSSRTLAAVETRLKGWLADSKTEQYVFPLKRLLSLVDKKKVGTICCFAIGWSSSTESCCTDIIQPQKDTWWTNIIIEIMLPENTLMQCLCYPYYPFWMLFFWFLGPPSHNWSVWFGIEIRRSYPNRISISIEKKRNWNQQNRKAAHDSHWEPHSNRINH